MGMAGTNHRADAPSRYPQPKPLNSGKGSLQKVDLDGEDLVYVIVEDESDRLLTFRTQLGNATILFTDPDLAYLAYVSVSMISSVRVVEVYARTFLTDLDSIFPDSLSGLAVVRPDREILVYRDSKSPPWQKFINLVEDLVSFGEMVDRAFETVDIEKCGEEGMRSRLNSALVSSLGDHLSSWRELGSWMSKTVYFERIPKGVIEEDEVIPTLSFGYPPQKSWLN